MFPVVRQLFRGFAIVALCVLAIPMTVFVCIVSGFIFMPLPANLPEPKSTIPSQASHIFDVNGKEIAIVRRHDQNVPVQESDIPAIFKQALVASEDKSFYKHKGIDPRGSIRALWADLRGNKVVQGGSTITQQYVKLAYTNREQTVSRKIREAILASQLDRQMDKDKILFNYASAVYFGEGTYGVGAAADSYFHKSVNQLSPSESATLVGLIPAPSRWSPRANINESEDRRKVVLQKMADQHYITQQQHADAVAHPLWLESQGPPPGPVTMVYNEQRPQAQFPYYVDYVTRYLRAKYGDQKVFTGGLRVQTALDPTLQADAEASVANTLSGTSPPLEMALTSVEPQTGFVKALVGGRDFDKAQVNLALGGCPPRPVNAVTKKPSPVQVEPTCWSQPTVTGGGTGRQPGSSFKAFVLAAAYEQGIQPTTVYNATSSWSSPGCTGPGCVVHNFEDEPGGPMNLKDATAHSINTVFAPLIRDIGSRQNGKVLSGFVDTANVAKKLGVQSAYYSEDFHRTGGQYALGTIDVAPLDMASAYGVFANRGLRQGTTPVIKVVDAKGTVLEDNSNRAPQRALDEAVADNVTDALRTVIDKGTAHQYGEIGRPAAGKTGTSEDYTNAWFVGYTPSLSTSVWMGYSDTPRTIVYKGKKQVGGDAPTATWASYMKEALADVPPTDFSQPAPLRKPVADVLGSGGPTTIPDISPGAQRKPSPTPSGSGSFDRTSGGNPSVNAPITTTTQPALAPPATAPPVAGH